MNYRFEPSKRTREDLQAVNRLTENESQRLGITGPHGQNAYVPLKLTIARWWFRYLPSAYWGSIASSKSEASWAENCNSA